MLQCCLCASLVARGDDWEEGLLNGLIFFFFLVKNILELVESRHMLLQPCKWTLIAQIYRFCSSNLTDQDMNCLAKNQQQELLHCCQVTFALHGRWVTQILTNGTCSYNLPTISPNAVVGFQSDLLPLTIRHFEVRRKRKNAKQKLELNQIAGTTLVTTSLYTKVSKLSTCWSTFQKPQLLPFIKRNRSHTSAV